MSKKKMWGIKIVGAWLTGHTGKDLDQGTTTGNAVDMTYDMKRKAQQDADDFNSMRKKGDNPYTVEEY